MRKAMVRLAVAIVSIAIGLTATAAQPLNTHAAATALITVSGTVTGPGGVVPNVWIGIGSPEDWKEMTTNASGFYSLALQTSGQIWINVRPGIATRLAQINYQRDGVTTSITQNFTLAAGHLLSLRFTSSGVPVTGNIWTEVQPLQYPIAVDRW